MRLIQEFRSSIASEFDVEVAPGLDLAARGRPSGGLLPEAMAPTVVDTAPDADRGAVYTPRIDVRFREVVDAALVNLSGVSFTHHGAVQDDGARRVK